MLVTVRFALHEPAAAVTQLHQLEEIRDALARTDALDGVEVNWDLRAARPDGPDATCIRMIVAATLDAGQEGDFGELAPQVRLNSYRKGGSGS